MLPGVLMPFKKDVNNIFRLEKAKLLYNKRFATVFSGIEIQPVFQNKANLKKLVVRAKVTKAFVLQECLSLKNSPHNTTHAL